VVRRVGAEQQWPILGPESEQAGVGAAMAKTTVVRTTDGRSSTHHRGPTRTGKVAKVGTWGRPERRRIDLV